MKKFFFELPHTIPDYPSREELCHYELYCESEVNWRRENRKEDESEKVSRYSDPTNKQLKPFQGTFYV